MQPRVKPPHTIGVTVTYNSQHVIADLVESAAPQLASHIIVDNASSDDTVSIVRGLRGRHPNVEIVVNRSNVGFAAGVNRGLRESGGRDVILLNPDCVIPSGTVSALEAKNRELGGHFALAPRLINSDHSPQESVRRFQTFMALLARRSAFGSTRMGNRISERHVYGDRDVSGDMTVDWAIGAVIFVPADVLSGVGLMDEGFFLYCEDVDWCARMWQRGYGVVFCPEITARHGYARQSRRTLSLSNRATRLHWASVLRLAMKHPALFFGIQELQSPRSPHDIIQLNRRGSEDQ